MENIETIQKVWVGVVPHKNTHPFIKCEKGIKRVSPNQLLIEVSKIMIMQTNGRNKNYIEVKCVDVIDTYFLNVSLMTICEKFIQFKRINKKQIININYVNGRLGDKYLFVNELYFKVSNKYKDNLDFSNTF